MKPFWYILLGFFVLFTHPTSLKAEIIQLTNGKAIRTEILEESVDSILVRAFNGRVRISKSKVKSIWRGEQADLLEIRNQRVFFAKGVTLYEKGQFKDAAGAFQRSLRSGDKAAVHINLGSTYAALGDLKKAEQSYLQAAKDSPHSIKAFLNLGRIYLTTRQYEKAAASLKSVLLLEENQEEALESLAYAEYALGHYEEATKLYAKMKRSNNLHILNNQAAAYIQSNYFDQAEEILSKITKENPDFDRGILNLALLARKKRDFAKAEIYYSKVLQRNEKNLQAWMAYGDFSLEKEDVSGAREAFEKALEIDPRSLEALTALYQLEMDQKDFTQAKKYLDQMQTAFPDQADIQDELGIFYLKTKQPEKALPVFEKIILTWPDKAEAYTHQGLAHAFLGKTDAAIISWNKALELDPEQKAASTNLKMLQDILKGSPDPETNSNA